LTRIDPALEAYFRDVSRASRAAFDRPAASGAVPITGEQVRAFRHHATGLDARLDRPHLAMAAAGGLQDSSPRAGLLSVHAV
jgi:hypothetical protein